MCMSFLHDVKVSVVSKGKGLGRAGRAGDTTFSSYKYAARKYHLLVVQQEIVINLTFLEYRN